MAINDVALNMHWGWRGGNFHVSFKSS